MPSFSLSVFPRRLVAALLALPLLAVSSFAAAFPGAEGFGANAVGGRSSGATVYHVTNLNDSGTGSFRDAVGTAKRIVVFDVGGVIRINSPVVVAANVTIAGQTAPGDGVTVYGNRISFSNANQTICRYIRFRMGIVGDAGADAVGIASGNDMIFDHVSASWGRDETFSISGDAAVRITLQDCLVGQGLLIHSAGGLMQTSGGVSIFRTLYADNWMRNPKVKGVNDYINNVVYNWGSGGGYIPAGDSAGDTFANMIGCYFIGGPNSGAGTSPFKTGNLNYRLYHTGNLQDLDLDGVLDGTAVLDASFPTLQIVGTPFAYPAPNSILTANQALQHIVAYAGASKKRDSVDAYMINELLTYGTSGAHIVNEAEVGGTGVVNGGLISADTDGDGMPDWWESAAGTNPALATDFSGDVNGDGYWNIENYLNAIAVAGVPAGAVTGISTDTGSVATDGVTQDNTLVINGTAPAGATVSVYRVDQTAALGTAVANGSGQWSFDYTGTALADRWYAFFAIVDLGGGKFSPPTVVFPVKVDNSAAATPTIGNVVVSPATVLNGISEPFALVTVDLAGTGPVANAAADVFGNWSATYVGPALVAGPYTFTATATDLAGNVGAPSAAYVFDPSATVPAVTGIGSDLGTSATDQITSDTTLNVLGTAPAGATVTVFRDATLQLGTAVADGSGNWTFNYTGTTLKAGTYAFTATLAGGAGNSAASAPLATVIDTTIPVVSSIVRLAPATPSTLSTTLAYRVTFNETVSGVDITDFSLTNSGTGMTGTITGFTPVSSTVYDVTVTGAAGDGTIRVDRKATGTGIIDVAGNAISTTAFTTGQTYTMRVLGSGVWGNAAGGTWSNLPDWDNTWGGIADGTGTTADFTNFDVVDNAVVTLDSPRTLGRLLFSADHSDETHNGLWRITDGGNAANQITFATGGTPTLQVIAASTPGQANPDLSTEAAATPATIDAVLKFPGALTKTGWGTAILTKTPVIPGAININEGQLRFGPGVNFTGAGPTIAVSTQFHVAGGTYTATSDVAMTSGTGAAVIVSAGTASFQKIVPTNARNGLVKVTGGTMTATDISFQRSGDAANMWAFGIVTTGGTSTIGTVGLGTGNSWGNMSVEGGTVTVTGPLYVGYQATSTRGGQLRVLAGELNTTSTLATGGLILGRNPGSNANNVAEFTIAGGVSNISRMVLGYDATSSAGSATVSVTNGELNLGSGGIVKNGTAGMATSITLNSGKLGAMANWSTTHPIVIAGTPATLQLRAADKTNAPFDFALNGALTGTGGFSKTGGGQLTLGATNTYGGATAIDAGTLKVTGSLTASAVSLNAGGRLANTGTFGAGVTFNGGGTLAADLGVVTPMSVTGVLAKGTAGTYALALSSAGAPTAGTAYTLANFGSTTFSAGNFTVTGNSGYLGVPVVNATSLQFLVTGVGASAEFGHWAYLAGLTAGNNGPLDDADLDGTNNLLEFVLAGDPLAAGASGLTPVTVNDAGTDYPGVTFTRRQALGGVTAAVQCTADLAWAALLGTVEQSVTPNGNGTETVVLRSTTPLAVEPRQFFRLQATLP